MKSDMIILDELEIKKRLWVFYFRMSNLSVALTFCILKCVEDNASGTYVVTLFKQLRVHWLAHDDREYVSLAKTVMFMHQQCIMKHIT